MCSGFLINVLYQLTLSLRTNSTSSFQFRFKCVCLPTTTYIFSMRVSCCCYYVQHHLCVCLATATYNNLLWVRCFVRFIGHMCDVLWFVFCVFWLCVKCILLFGFSCVWIRFAGIRWRFFESAWIIRFQFQLSVVHLYFNSGTYQSLLLFVFVSTLYCELRFSGFSEHTRKRATMVAFIIYVWWSWYLRGTEKTNFPWYNTTLSRMHALQSLLQYKVLEDEKREQNGM